MEKQEKQEVSESQERTETARKEVGDWGNDYDRRLSVRVNAELMAIVERGAEHENKNKGEFVRDMIRQLGAVMDKRGL